MTPRRKQLIRAAIIAEIERRGETRSWLARRIGMHPNEINRALSDGYDMRVSTAEKMLKALGLTIERGQE